MQQTHKVTAFWDQSSKSPKQKTKYLGVADSKEGKITKPGKTMVMSIEKPIVDFDGVYSKTVGRY